MAPPCLAFGHGCKCIRSPTTAPAACLPSCLGCRSRLLENEIRVLRDESNRLTHEKAGLAERVKENHEKIKLNNQLPYLVANIVEVLEVDPEEEEEEDGEHAGWGCCGLAAGRVQAPGVGRAPHGVCHAAAAAAKAASARPAAVAAQPA